jgi:hypothetical protein
MPRASIASRANKNAPTHCGGNAKEIGYECKGRGGWFVGHYHESCHPILASYVVEMKWGVHGARESRCDWDKGRPEWSLSVLIRGNFSIEFADKTYPLTKRGDFVIWGPGVPHTWRANARSVILTVRWRERKYVGARSSG